MPNTVSLTHSQLGSTTHSPHQHADLSLPNGSLVGQVDTETLRRLLAPFVEGAHTRPRLEIIADYAKELRRVYDTAGEAAVERWWKEKSSC
jgi:hypothetical protein